MLKIDATNSTPLINISIEDCIFEIKGHSFANNADTFYEPVIAYIDKEFPNIECEMKCKFYLSVFNSVTYKYILNMMTKFVQFYRAGKNIKIVWYYDKDDESSKESAEDIDELFDIPFEFKEVTN